MQAVQTIGWSAHLRDASLTRAWRARACSRRRLRAPTRSCSPASTAGLVAQLQAAKAAGVLLIDPLGFDCNDPHVGGKAVFSAYFTYSGGEALQTYMTDWARAGRPGSLGASHGTAKVIDVTLDGVLTPTYADQGFHEMMAKCSGCQVVETVHLTLADLGSGAAQQKVATPLQSNPTATYLDSPFDSAILASPLGEGQRPEEPPDHGRRVASRSTSPTSAPAVRRVPAARWPRTGGVGRGRHAEPALRRRDPVPAAGHRCRIPARGQVHNLPASGDYVPPVNFKAAYEKVWGKA